MQEVLETKLRLLTRTNDEIDQQIESRKKLLEDLKGLEIKEEYSKQEVLNFIKTIIVDGNQLLVTLEINGELIELPEAIYF